MKMSNAQGFDADLQALASPQIFTSFAAGTAYTLTNTATAMAFGTTSPSITITAPGTYLIIAKARFENVGATFAATRLLTCKLRRTNNTPADLTGGSALFNTPVITALTSTLTPVDIITTYTTANSDDVVSLFGDLGTVPSAGSVTCNEASIVAVRMGA